MNARKMCGVTLSGLTPALSNNIAKNNVEIADGLVEECVTGSQRCNVQGGHERGLFVQSDFGKVVNA